MYLCRHIILQDVPEEVSVFETPGVQQASGTIVKYNNNVKCNKSSPRETIQDGGKNGIMTDPSILPYSQLVKQLSFKKGGTAL